MRAELNGGTQRKPREVMANASMLYELEAHLQQRLCGQPTPSAQAFAMTREDTAGVALKTTRLPTTTRWNHNP